MAKMGIDEEFKYRDGTKVAFDMRDFALSLGNYCALGYEPNPIE